MGFVIAIVIMVTWVVALRKHGPASFAAAGVLGLTIYSIPAVVNLRIPFDEPMGSERYLVSGHELAQIVVLIAWVTVLLVYLVTGGRSKRNGGTATVHHPLSDFSSALLLLGVIGFVYLSAQDGLTFFLKSREEQISDLVSLLWKWTSLLGLIATTLSGEKRKRIFFALLTIVIFLRGDRTMIALSFVAVAILSFREYRSILNVLRLRYLVAGASLAMLIFIGKPLYLAVKAGEMAILSESVSADAMQTLWLNFEPFATYNHLDVVIATGFTISIPEFLGSIFGHLLVMPSFFGVDTNVYNEAFTAALPLASTFGLAGNFWAHAWSVGAYMGVVIFAVAYAGSLVLSDQTFGKASPVGQVLIAAIATTVAVYAHRNGLDNLLSFVRQILIVAGVSYLLAFIIKGARKGLRRGPDAFRPKPLHGPQRGMRTANPRHR